MSAAKVVVFGSINMDLVIRCQHLPRPGETIIARSSQEVPGGKGANQAVAAARLGAQVFMVGRVGNDAFATRLVQNLRNEGIDVSAVGHCSDVASGLAVVNVEDSGENSILVVPGSNHRLSPSDVDAARHIIQQSDLVLVQLEVPLESVRALVALAKSLGKPVILNPAPTPPDFPADLFQVDLICPNQTEASALLGQPINSVGDAKAAIAQFLTLGAKSAVITLGSQGAVVHDGQQITWIPPFPITAVDTTAAGDAFAGALATRLCEGTTLLEAARFAAAAGAFAATQPGAQPGMPRRNDVEILLSTSP